MSQHIKELYIIFLYVISQKYYKLNLKTTATRELEYLPSILAWEWTKIFNCFGWQLS